MTAPEQTSAMNHPDPAQRLLYAVTAEDLIDEYEDIAAAQRWSHPDPPTDFWPPWAKLPPERQESIVTQTAAALKEIIARRCWNLLEEALYRADSLPAGSSRPAQQGKE